MAKSAIDSDNSEKPTNTQIRQIKFGILTTVSMSFIRAILSAKAKASLL
jgi:hypothetical protein